MALMNWSLLILPLLMEQNCKALQVQKIWCWWKTQVGRVSVSWVFCVALPLLSLRLALGMVLEPLADSHPSKRPVP